MQIVFFAKSDNPTGRLKNAERYGYSVSNGMLLGVSLIGTLTEKDEETWQAPRAEVSLCVPANADNAVAAFRQAATEIGGYPINENYIRAVFEDEALG